MTSLREQPKIVTIGKNQRISTGQLNIEIVAGYILDNGANKWVEVSDLAKLAYGRPFKENLRRVRKELHRIRKRLITLGYFMIAEHDGSLRGRPYARVKILIKDSDYERQLAELTLKALFKRNELSAEMYEMARLLVERDR